MAKSTQLLTLLLLLASAACAAAGGNPATGVDAACSKTPCPDFCEMLLMPCAAEFADDKDTKKMGNAALNATIQRVQNFKLFMAGQGATMAKSNDLKAAVTECVDRIGRGAASLQSAVQEFNNARGAAPEANAPRKMGKVEDPVKMINGASAELTGCLDALKKSEEAAGKADGGAGVSGDVNRQAMRSANETVLACSVAKTFVSMP